MNIKNLLRLSILASLLATAASVQAAEEDITVSATVQPGRMPPTWVSLSGFSGEAESLLRFDLYVQGFNFTNSDNALYIISGSNNGNLQARVNMRAGNAPVMNLKGYTGGTITDQVHLFVDEFVTAAHRIPIARTKIAFKRDTGANSEIYVSDFDGFSVQAVTADNTIVAAPTWAPGKLALYYTSYKLGNPDIFFHDLSSGQRHVFSRYSGLNSSATVCPANGKVAMILSKGGSPDVYACNADGSGLIRLTATREDESSPCWSPDGEWICYATKVGGRRVLQKVRATGGAPQTISTAGVVSPSEPDWSPDGKWIAFTVQMANFEICVVPAAGGPVTELVAGEDPSWSANSRTLVYARREGGRRVLSLLDVPTKQYKDISRITGSNSQPSWAK